MDIAKTIGANLTKWMDETPALDTIQKLEKESNIGFGTIRRARKGEGNITVEKLAAIAIAFRRHPAELLINSSADSQTNTLTDGGDSIGGAQQQPDAAEPIPIPTVFQTSRQRDIEEIHAALDRINDSGIVAILEFTKHVARDQPQKVSQTQS